MNSWMRSPADLNPYRPAARDDALFASAVEALTVAAAEDDEVQKFMAGLHLLENVPAVNLAPDESMLPPESLRLFRLDAGWIAALVDGALSIGRLGVKDRDHDALVLSRLEPAVRRRSRALRSDRLCLSPPDAAANEDGRHGFLLRSQLVSGWPGLEVRCLQGNAVRTLLRLTVLGGETMLCLVDGSFDVIELTEPAEGMHFGFVEQDGKLTRPLAALKPDGDRGKDIAGESAAIPFRDGAAGVVDISALAGTINRRLTELGKEGDHMSAVEFGIQMLHKRTRAVVRVAREK